MRIERDAGDTFFFFFNVGALVEGFRNGRTVEVE